MEDFYYKYYITADDSGRITDGFSTAFQNPETTDICINEQGGYQFRLFAGGEENPALFESHRVPIYKYENGAVSTRTAEEIQSDIDAIPAADPTIEEQNRADIDYIAIMMGVDL